MAKPTIATNPAAVTLPSKKLEWRNFTVVGTGFATTTKVTPQPGSTYSYYLDYTQVNDAMGNARDDVLIISVSRQKKKTARRVVAASSGDSDNLNYTVTNTADSLPVTVVVVYE
jgi:hypothetical protein